MPEGSKGEDPLSGDVTIGDRIQATCLRSQGELLES